MNFYSYRIEHDYGLAPNPFWGYCTLAVCKPKIRNNKNLEIGDWIFAQGSKSLGNLNHLMLAMQVEEKLTFEEYWNDSRFELKKPVVNGTLAQMYGDNFYHKDSDGNWIQENSAHSTSDCEVNQKHLETDTNGEFVLISKNFYYFGDSSFLDEQVKIPEKYLDVFSDNGRGMMSVSIPNDLALEFLEWIQENFDKGIHGDPIDWKNHQQQIIRFDK